METRPEHLVWSEEDMAYVAPVREPTGEGRARFAGGVRRAVLAQSQAVATTRPHELTRGAAVVFAPEPAGEDGTARHGNFIDASYRRIAADPAWRARLDKVHTGKWQARPTGPQETVREWRELDTAVSSDALLMNIFCYPGVLARGRLPALLGVEARLRPQFGYRPALLLERALKDRTEIDMRLGSLLVEAKLTEAGFQAAPLRLVERYPSFDKVFERESLTFSRRGVASYQLLRGVLAAEAEGGSFCVLCDARRPDLVEAWHALLLAVKSYELRTRLRLHTWQEIALVCPRRLREFLVAKYGIVG